MNAQPLFIGQRLETFIEKLSFSGGRGVSKDQGMVIFVEGAAPQEKAVVEITKVKKRFAEAKIIKVLEPSPARREPPCKVFHECGGCNLQHIQYSEQIKQKSFILLEQLRPLLKHQDFEVRDFVFSPMEFNYRNRVQFHLKAGKVGFFARGSHRIADTDYCWLVEENINEQLKQLRKPSSHLNTSRIEVRSPSSLGDNFFSQVNSLQNQKLQTMVAECVDQSRPTEVWDLYGGAGNFSFFMAQKFREIEFTCVEASHEAVRFGREKANRHNVANLNWECSPVEKFLMGQQPQPRFVLIDPPRAGLSSVALRRLGPLLGSSKLMYLSCNPSTFVRDASEILQVTPLKLKWVQGIDMFPQTDHIELLSFFE